MILTHKFIFNYVTLTKNNFFHSQHLKTLKTLDISININKNNFFKNTVPILFFLSENKPSLLKTALTKRSTAEILFVTLSKKKLNNFFYKLLIFYSHNRSKQLNSKLITNSNELKYLLSNCNIDTEYKFLIKKTELFIPNYDLVFKFYNENNFNIKNLLSFFKMI